MPRFAIGTLLGLALPLGLAFAQQAERVSGPVPVSGVVFLDRNRNGVRDEGEPGLPDVAVSDQIRVAITDAVGRFQFDAMGYGLVFVAPPDGYLPAGPSWRRAEAGRDLVFPVVPAAPVTSFTFLHASDTHVRQSNLARMQRLRTITDSLRPSFVLISGDLVRDALRVSETEAKGYYDLFVAELGRFRVPVHTVPGNHEIFGIERHHSLVSPTHPLYGKRMYRSYLGPNYYSFTYGGVHFVGLDTVDYDDLWYNGHVDSLQLGWLAADLAALKPGIPVVTFNHIPLVTAGEVIDGFSKGGPAAPSSL